MSLQHQIHGTTPAGARATLTVMRDRARDRLLLLTMEPTVALDGAQWEDLLQCLSFPPTGWLTPREQRPPSGQAILIADAAERVGEAVYREGLWYWRDGDCALEVIAWRHLPPAPRAFPSGGARC